MYVPDNYDAFCEHEAAMECSLAKLPECSECGEKIQDEFCFEVNDELICHKCMNENHRKWTDDCI